MKKILKWLGILFALMIITYLLGPRPTTPQLATGLPDLPSDLTALDSKINREEATIPTLKEDNEARIVWYDSTQKTKTPYSVVYIHGFSASQAEGAPLHREFAKRYGCNLYLARLDKHGLDDADAFGEMTPESLLNSAKEAVRIGQLIGEKLIIISTSTGATLSMFIASGNPDIEGLILYSPLVDFFDGSSYLLNKPWGLQLAKMMIGDYFDRGQAPPKVMQYWTPKYRVEALITLKSLVDATMTKSTFENITQPVFLGYYYKDEENQDKTVSVNAMLEMYAQLGTPEAQKRKTAFPNVGNHVIASYIASKDLKSVREETYRFAEEVLKLKSVKNRPISAN